MNINRIISDKSLVTFISIVVSLGSVFIVVAAIFHDIGGMLSILFHYIRDLGIALLVSIPILIAIELYNQKRHASREEMKIQEFIQAVWSRGVPQAICSAVDDSVFNARFYRDDYRVSYVIAPLEVESNLVRISATQEFLVKKLKRSDHQYEMRPAITITRENRGVAFFSYLRVGSASYGREQLAEIAREENGSLVIDLDPISISESGTQVELRFETAYAIGAPYEGVICMAAATGLEIRIECPKGLKIILDTLHQEDMLESAQQRKDGGTDYVWRQTRGILPGQGALFRWELTSSQQVKA